MLIQYFKIAFRNMMKNKIFTFINILSLSSGIMFCLLIYLFAHQELTHDTFHENQERIYRVVYKYTDPDEGGYNYSTLHEHRIAEAFSQEISGIEKVTTFKNTYRSWINHQNKSFENTVAFVDTTFFNIFSFPVLAGNPDKMLAEVNHVVMSKKTAEKYFGKPNHNYSEFIGRNLTFPKGKEKEFVVSGIVNVPSTSSIDFDMAIRHQHHCPYPESNNFTGNASMFVLLDESNNVTSATEGANGLIETYLGEKLDNLIKYFFKEGDNPTFEYYFQPIADVYLNEDIRSQYEAESCNQFITVLVIVAILVLVISCINYIMLTTGQSFQRMKEIGMRKVLGARSGNINTQFWGEALVISMISLLLGILLAKALLPLFNYLSNREITFDLLKPSLLIFIVLLLFGITTIVGLVPGLNINKISAISLFRNKNRLAGKQSLTSVFVVIQYTLSILFVISTLIIINQMNFIRDKNTGIEEKDVVVVNLPDDFSVKQTEQFRQLLNAKPTVINVASSDRNFMFGSSSTNLRMDDGETFSCRLIRADANYIPTLGLELIAGRNFALESNSDSLHAVIVNETFVKTLGWDHAVGKKLPKSDSDDKMPTIIGVVKDFHFDSMRDKVEPLFLHMDPDRNPVWYHFAKIDGLQVSASIEAINKAWSEMNTNRPLGYSFLSDILDQQYESEEKFAKITGYAAIFTIVLSSLGLFGLTLLVVSRRTKEIGIRKVNGASTSSILVLFSKDFTRWVLIALVLASPMAYWAMQKWLQEYAYRIEIGWWVFVAGGVFALLTALITISYQIVKAALANPVKSLRYE